MQRVKSYLKFLIKINLIGAARRLLLFWGKAPVNKNGCEERMLILTLEGLGDLVLMTGVLKHYKKDFPTKKIYFLVNSNTGTDGSIFAPLVDEVMFLDYQTFTRNPWYGFQFINDLRRIGFSRVINHDPSVAEVQGKIIAASIGAREVIGYEGLGIQFKLPFDVNMRKGIEYVQKRIFPHYTKIIPSIDKDNNLETRLLPFLRHYIAIYETATGIVHDEYEPQLTVPISSEKNALLLLKKNNIPEGKYCVLSLSTTTMHREWQSEKFAQVLNELKDLHIPIVLIGTKKDHALAERFRKIYQGTFLNIIGQTSVAEAIALVHHAFFSFSNDTSITHIAVALKKPSLTILGLGHFGMLSLYGYPDINRWVYKKMSCLCDNWRCIHTVGENEPTPCISGIEVSHVSRELRALVDSLRHRNVYPTSRFQIEFSERASRSSKRTKKIKIIYTGIQAENYDPRRRLSFEYNNFYLTLQHVPGARVIEYPYDSIITVGRKKFNQNLLELIKKEKPDLFFAFMFTDELDPATLDEIKKHTTSLAWFADDHWRLENYSRLYAPHFTWVVTTWSGAPERYAAHGIKNVIRSQWACNQLVWKPVNVPRDIEVSFIGQYNSARAKIIEKLRRAGVDVWVRGWGWPEGRLSQPDMVAGFSRSKINLNFNVPPERWRLRLLGRLFLRRSMSKIVPDVSRFFDNLKSWRGMATPQIKARPFEILGCRTFLISNFADDMNRYYEDKKEIVYYDGTIADLVLKIRYYLSHEDEREAIARAGYERTLREHTYEKRFEEIFEKIFSEPS